MSSVALFSFSIMLAKWSCFGFRPGVVELLKLSDAAAMDMARRAVEAVPWRQHRII